MATRVRRAGPKTEGKTATKKVMVGLYRSGEEEVSDIVLEEREVRFFEADPAYVRVAAGTTSNLGNFESLRVDVAISVPCYQETIEETFEEVAAQVNDLLTYEVDNYKRSMKSGPAKKKTSSRR